MFNQEIAKGYNIVYFVFAWKNNINGRSIYRDWLA